jgi:hypothetical protein
MSVISSYSHSPILLLSYFIIFTHTAAGQAVSQDPHGAGLQTHTLTSHLPTGIYMLLSYMSICLLLLLHYSPTVFYSHSPMYHTPYTIYHIPYTIHSLVTSHTPYRTSCSRTPPCQTTLSYTPQMGSAVCQDIKDRY